MKYYFIYFRSRQSSIATFISPTDLQTRGLVHILSLILASFDWNFTAKKTSVDVY